MDFYIDDGLTSEERKYQARLVGPKHHYTYIDSLYCRGILSGTVGLPYSGYGQNYARMGRGTGTSAVAFNYMIQAMQRAVQ